MEQFNYYKINKSMVQDILNFLDRVHSYDNGLQDAFKMVQISNMFQTPINMKAELDLLNEKNNKEIKKGDK